MKAVAVCRMTIKVINQIVDIIVLTIVMMLIAFAFYALWDSDQIYKRADRSQYTVYKPTIENEGLSFQELQAINPEVIAWLTVYGTNIDYPVTQGKDNLKYVRTDAKGNYSLTGSIFLDSGNSSDFSDFNSILYGHHMEKQTMFGEIGEFADERTFYTHRYGDLYVEGTNYGIEFFVFLSADAYDRTIFIPGVKGDRQQEYLDSLMERAILARDIGVTTDDRIILLATCASDSTNGRDILVGRLSDEVFEDPFAKTETDSVNNGQGAADNSQLCVVSEIPLWVELIVLVMLIWLLVRIRRLLRMRKGRKVNANVDGEKGRN